ncbi:MULTISPECIES: hypothetical protein [Clostridia]|uniref:Uncharacterized protein n=1 Tax=Blautia faecis TaxID=871665 RepID=A0ABX2HCG5_9FIRM|nr:MULTISPECIES: hypothetical protein [Clostridia]MCQ4932983.1 hypothetical protein [Blautia faecis]MDB8754909.1 hypothetical protein [Ruminococcus sp. 1001136sp1]MDB8758253.1 hypothetical protein [Ruminococcus sp. 1001136sp1]MDB8763070.1 hypothetical protein [Ruminococcus sp. 1001136sp1]MDB8766525.1 hypothetical protein [Ruminococcus sp. 1001136sp1]
MKLPAWFQMLVVVASVGYVFFIALLRYKKEMAEIKSQARSKTEEYITRSLKTIAEVLENIVKRK